MAVVSKKLSDYEMVLKDGGTNDSYYSIDFPLVASMGAGVLNTAKQGYIVLPGDVQIISVEGITETQTGNVTFDVWNEAGTPATILSTVGTDTAALTAAAGTVSSPTTTYAQGSIFSLRCTTVASTGAATNLHVSLLVKNARGNQASA